MDYLENRTFAEINIGDSASLKRTLTERDIQVFAIMSGDINPAHVDVEYAQSDMFHKIIGHGMWGGALISTVLGTLLPGPGTIYVKQSLRFKKPVVLGDTLTVTVIAKEKIPEKNRIIFTCQCHNQRSELVMEGEAEIVAPTKKIRRLKTVMPLISLRRNKSLLEKYVEAARHYPALTAAVLNPIHGKIIQAVAAATQAGLIKPILIGPRAAILEAATGVGVDITPYPLIEVAHSQAAIIKALALVHRKEIGIIIRGAVTREDLLKAMQKPEKGLLTDHVLSYVSVVDVPTYPKALILTDTLINIHPHLETKRAITQNAIHFALALGIKQPKVAIIAALDTITETMRSTIDAAALCKMAERGQIEGGVLDGPLTFDTVISSEVAKAKAINSSVIGDADILVVPNVETGAMLVKQLEYLAEANQTGLLVGSRVPVLMSHINDIYLSTVACALAILITAAKKE